MAYEAKLFIPDDQNGNVTDVVRNSLTNEFGGCTVITDADGSWASPKMQTVVDDDVNLVLVTTEREPTEKLENYAEYIKERLDQESVHFTVNEVDSFFV